MAETCNHVAAAKSELEAAVKIGLTKPLFTSSANQWLLCSKDIKPTKNEDLNLKYLNVKCLGSLMDETMFGEAMTLNVIHKINNNPKFLYCKNNFLTPTLR